MEILPKLDANGTQIGNITKRSLDTPLDATNFLGMYK